MSGAGGEPLGSLPPKITGGGFVIGGIWSPGEDRPCSEGYEAMIVFQMGILKAAVVLSLASPQYSSIQASPRLREIEERGRAWKSISPCFSLYDILLGNINASLSGNIYILHEAA